MLTKTFDFTKVMCVQYWPASKDKDECYGELPEYQIYIGVMKEEELANFHIRTFRLYKMHNNVRIASRYLFLTIIFSSLSRAQQEIIVNLMCDVDVCADNPNEDVYSSKIFHPHFNEIAWF